MPSLTTFFPLPLACDWNRIGLGGEVDGWCIEWRGIIATISCHAMHKWFSPLKFVNSRTICYTKFIFLSPFFSSDTRIWTMRWPHVAKYCTLPFIHCNRSINHWIKWVMIIALKAFPCFFFAFFTDFLCIFFHPSSWHGWVRRNHWAKRLNHWWV